MATGGELRTQLGRGQEYWQKLQKEVDREGSWGAETPCGQYGKKHRFWVPAVPPLASVGPQLRLVCPDKARPLLPAVFAFSSSYAFLLIARSLQGIGSSCSSVAGRCGNA